MKHDEYCELLRLADALIFISESELLGSICSDAGFNPSTACVPSLLKLVANSIYSNLTE